MKQLLHILGFLGLLVASVARSETAPGTSAAATDAIEVGNFHFDLVSPWADKGSTRPMVKAVAVWTDPDREASPTIEAAFYHFGKGQGGSIPANIQRWKKQFTGEVEEAIDELDRDGQKVVIIHLRGTYLDGPMFGKKTPKAKHALLGAILESNEGAVFLKATAPESLAEACKESFRKLALSPFEKNP